MTSLLSSVVPAQEIAVLARTNSQLNSLERAMNGAKLPYQVRSTERFFDRPDVKEFLKGVRSASVIPTEGINWLDELRTLAQPFLSGQSIDGIAGLLHLARELDEDTNFSPKTLRSYLREWERVFLMGANVGLLPLETNGFTLDSRMIEEERRLFYVGMTRAKRELRISYRGKPSPFLAQAGLLTS